MGDAERLTAGGLVLVVLLALMGRVEAVEPPQKWWPSEWSAEDQQVHAGDDLIVRPSLRVTYRRPPLDSLWRCRNTATSASEKWTAS